MMIGGNSPEQNVGMWLSRFSAFTGTGGQGPVMTIPDKDAIQAREPLGPWGRNAMNMTLDVR